jgi:hypothetical protein
MMVSPRQDRCKPLIVDSRERAPAKASAGMFAPDGLAMSFPLASTSGACGRRAGHGARCRHGAQALGHEEAGRHAGAGDRTRRARVSGSTGFWPRTSSTIPAAPSFIPRPQRSSAPAACRSPRASWLVQPDLARTLRLIAAKGPEAFYRGAAGAARSCRPSSARATSSARPGAAAWRWPTWRSYQVAIREPLGRPVPRLDAGHHAAALLRRAHAAADAGACWSAFRSATRARATASAARRRCTRWARRCGWRLPTARCGSATTMPCRCRGRACCTRAIWRRARR